MDTLNTEEFRQQAAARLAEAILVWELNQMIPKASKNVRVQSYTAAMNTWIAKYTLQQMQLARTGHSCITDAELARIKLRMDCDYFTLIGRLGQANRVQSILNIQ